MVSFKTNERIDTVFKNMVLCENNKSEKDVISAEILKVIKSMEELEDKINYISHSISEKGENVILIAMLLYPKLNLSKAVNKLYKNIKIIDEKFNKIDNKKSFTKFIRIQKDVKKINEKLNMTKSVAAKIAYIKRIIELIDNCTIF